MNIEDLLTLARAGFTAEQIAALSKTDSTSVTTTPSTAEAAAPESQVTRPAPAVEAANEPEKVDRTDEIVNSIKELTNMIKASNIRSGGTQPQEQTIDSIVASIINP